MRVLLDAHVFLWNDLEPRKLPPGVLAFLRRADVETFLSVVSVWEIIIKQAIGKLNLDTPLLETVSQYRSLNNLQILQVALNHVFAVDGLPNHHKDPFDRLLIAQAISETMTIVTNDPAIAKYGVPILW